MSNNAVELPQPYEKKGSVNFTAENVVLDYSENLVVTKSDTSKYVIDENAGKSNSSSFLSAAKAQNLEFLSPAEDRGDDLDDLNFDFTQLDHANQGVGNNLANKDYNKRPNTSLAVSHSAFSHIYDLIIEENETDDPYPIGVNIDGVNASDSDSIKLGSNFYQSPMQATLKNLSVQPMVKMAADQFNMSSSNINVESRLSKKRTIVNDDEISLGDLDAVNLHAKYLSAMEKNKKLNNKRQKIANLQTQTYQIAMHKSHLNALNHHLKLFFLDCVDKLQSKTTQTGRNNEKITHKTAKEPKKAPGVYDFDKNISWFTVNNEMVPPYTYYRYTTL